MKDPCEKRHNSWGLADFRVRFPALRLTHLPDCALLFEGELAFRAMKIGFQEITDVYEIKVIIPVGFPLEQALVFEIGGRIADGYHKFSDKSLCLGSPVRIQKEMFEHPTLIGLVDRLIIPYLYNHSYQERTGELPVGELRHGAPGLVQDYEELFRLSGPQQCVAALELLGMKKGIANKRPCPCGSGRRLGRCHCWKLTPLRRLAPKSFYRHQARFLLSELNTTHSNEL